MTPDERLAVAALKRLAKRWPPTLWLFCDGNGLKVMRRGPDGERVTTPRGEMSQEAIVDVIDIPADGGDW